MSADRTAPGGASLQLIPPFINVVVQSLHSPVVCVAREVGKRMAGRRGEDGHRGAVRQTSQSRWKVNKSPNII